MKDKKKSTKYSLAAITFALGSIILYELFSDAKLIPLSIQFKIFIALSVITLALLLAAIFYSVVERNIKLSNSFMLVATLSLIAFNYYISHQAIISFLTPTEIEMAREERFEKIESLKASEIKKIEISRYLQPRDYQNIKSDTTSEGLRLVREINSKESIADFITILKNCSFEKWPRYKSKGDAFYIILYSVDNSQIEFDVSHIKDTENTYEIFAFNSDKSIGKEHYGAAYSDEIYKWLNNIN